MVIKALLYQSPALCCATPPLGCHTPAAATSPPGDILLAYTLAVTGKVSGGVVALRSGFHHSPQANGVYLITSSCSPYMAFMTPESWLLFLLFGEDVSLCLSSDTLGNIQSLQLSSC